MHLLCLACGEELTNAQTPIALTLEQEVADVAASFPGSRVELVRGNVVEIIQEGDDE